jgi:aminomethyltransferase
MKTELFEEHKKLNAHIVDFHGWDMPLYYTSIITEHNYVRKAAGVFDVSHMGDIIVSGNGSIDFLEHILPSNISGMEIGTCMYTAFLNNDGNIIDDTIIYRIDLNEFLTVPNASTTEKIYEWMIFNSKGYDVKINNVSNKFSCLALQGPLSESISNKLNIKFQKSFTFSGSLDTMIVSGTGYTGEKGIEIIVKNEEVVVLWNKILNELKQINGGPCGLGARDTLRMEKGMLLSGQDFDNNKDPVECSISFIMSNKGDYIGKESIEKRNHNEIFRGFIIDDRGIPRHGNSVIDQDGNKIGLITSGTMSPTLNKGIALGFINKNYSKPGSKVFITVREKNIPATVSRPKLVP